VRVRCRVLGSGAAAVSLLGGLSSDLASVLGSE
jgi:hypothetical protein